MDSIGRYRANSKRIDFKRLDYIFVCMFKRPSTVCREKKRTEFDSFPFPANPAMENASEAFLYNLNMDQMQE